MLTLTLEVIAISIDYFFLYFVWEGSTSHRC
jgi:hypothetical protein